VHGGFTPTDLSLLIDTHLKAHVADRYGCKLTGPEALAEADPDVIVIMSRGFAERDRDRSRRLAPRAEIVLYADLLARAHIRKAA
jgi:ABC-type Fe3+-hydroxamate transport system substrate-binding protein